MFPSEPILALSPPAGCGGLLDGDDADVADDGDLRAVGFGLLLQALEDALEPFNKAFAR